MNVVCVSKLLTELGFRAQIARRMWFSYVFVRKLLKACLQNVVFVSRLLTERGFREYIAQRTWFLYAMWSQNVVCVSTLLTDHDFANKFLTERGFVRELLSDRTRFSILICSHNKERGLRQQIAHKCSFLTKLFAEHCFLMFFLSKLFTGRGFREQIARRTWSS